MSRNYQTSGGTCLHLESRGSPRWRTGGCPGGTRARVQPRWSWSAPWSPSPRPRCWQALRVKAHKNRKSTHSLRSQLAERHIKARLRRVVLTKSSRPVGRRRESARSATDLPALPLRLRRRLTRWCAPWWSGSWRASSQSRCRSRCRIHLWRTPSTLF